MKVHNRLKNMRNSVESNLTIWKGYDETLFVDLFTYGVYLVLCPPLNFKNMVVSNTCDYNIYYPTCYPHVCL